MVDHKGCCVDVATLLRRARWLRDLLDGHPHLIACLSRLKRRVRSPAAVEAVRSCSLNAPMTPCCRPAPGRSDYRSKLTTVQSPGARSCCDKRDADAAWLAGRRMEPQIPGRTSGADCLRSTAISGACIWDTLDPSGGKKRAATCTATLSLAFPPGQVSDSSQPHIFLCLGLRINTGCLP